MSTGADGSREDIVSGRRNQAESTTEIIADVPDDTGSNADFAGTVIFQVGPQEGELSPRRVTLDGILGIGYAGNIGPVGPLPPLGTGTGVVGWGGVVTGTGVLGVGGPEPSHLGGAGVVGVASGGDVPDSEKTSNVGVFGHSNTGSGGAFESGSKTGVAGSSGSGTGGIITSTSGVGVIGHSENDRGGVFSFGKLGKSSAQLRLTPL